MPAIQFHSIRKSFKFKLKRQVVLHDLSLAVEQGDIFGFLGPNGAGKSTAIKLLLGFIRPDKGSMSVQGRTVGREPFHHHIGYLTETPCFYENLNGLETLYFAGRASGMKAGAVRERSLTVLEQLELAHAAKRQIRTYSKGMKQRLGLAMALIHDPDIYILDEPMSGLDPLGRSLITQVLLDLGQKGKTVFFSSHILSDVERLCNRVSILNKGELLFVGSVNDFLADGSGMEAAFVRLIESHERPLDV